MSIFNSSSEGAHATDVVACTDSALIHDAVLAAVEAGALLSFGSSRDGGAVSVGWLCGGPVDRVWCSTSDELERALRAIVGPAGGGRSTGVEGRPVSPSEGNTEASQAKPAGQGKNRKGT